MAQLHQEVLEGVGPEPPPKRRTPRPKTSLHYPDFTQDLPLRVHFLAQGSLLRERAAALSEYAPATERQTAETGETLLSVACSKNEVWLFERLVETLGAGGIHLPFNQNGGFETIIQRKNSFEFTEAAAKMAEDNNDARTYTWQFERIVPSPLSPPIPAGKPRVPDDLPWDPDPVFQDILDKTQRDDLDAALTAVENVDPARREVLFDEVLYLKFCVRAPIAAQDLRYVTKKYINRSSIKARLTEEFEAFLETLNSMLSDSDFFKGLSYPWDQLTSWPEFKAGAYRDFDKYGHISYPRGRLFIWHPNFYAHSPENIDRTFVPFLVEAENIFRRERDIPEIGRGWASEAALLDLVRSRFPDAEFQWSPHWLGRQSVDIYVPSINVAFEYQGEQHYKPVDLFGGKDGFLATKARDARKRERLERQGVTLVEWSFDTPIVTDELDRVLALLKRENI